MKSLKTQLEDRELRYDGVVVLDPDRLADAFLKGVQPCDIRVTHHTEETERFNQLVDEDDEVRLDGDPVRIDYEWQIPPEYLQLDVYARVAAEYEKLMPDLSSRYTPAQFDAALDRISVELSEFERRGMINFLRTIIYILDVFRRDGVVWGVGRGSSCASYVLFILGLHSVDSILYNTPMEEFFHD